MIGVLSTAVDRVTRRPSPGRLAANDGAPPARRTGAGQVGMRHFAVTDAAGRFRIAGVAAGVHRLSVRQPAVGLSRDVRVRVAAGEVAHVAVSFTASDSRERED